MKVKTVHGCPGPADKGFCLLELTDVTRKEMRFIQDAVTSGNKINLHVIPKYIQTCFSVDRDEDGSIEIKKGENSIVLNWIEVKTLLRNEISPLVIEALENNKKALEGVYGALEAKEPLDAIKQLPIELALAWTKISIAKARGEA